MTPEPAEERGSRLPPSLLIFLCLIVIGLLSGIVLSYIDARSTERRLEALEEYVQGRGDYRDAEADRMEDQYEELVRRTACALLDGFPSSPLLDLRRAEFGCGPGLPPDAFPPEVQQELSVSTRPGVASPQAVQPAAPPPGSSAVPNPPRGVPSSPPQTSTPAPVPPAKPPPLVDLTPFTDPLCDLAGVCT